MGDRCYLEIHLHGQIGDLSALEEIGDALRGDNFNAGSPVANGLQTKDDFLLVCADAMAKGQNPLFYKDECNYADCSDVEAVLTEHRMPYHVSHSEGDDYDGSRWSWVPDGDGVKNGTLWRVTDNRDGPCVSLHELKKAMEAGTLAKMVDDAEKATGKQLPKFEPIGEVKEELARLLALEVLGVET